MSEGRKRERAFWGEPHLSFCPLRLWVHRYEFQEAEEEYDFLVATAEVVLPGAARVEVSGPFLTTRELSEFRQECAHLHVELAGNARLNTLEPELKWDMEMDALGHLETTIELTESGHRHSFEFQRDQSDLPGLLAQLDEILCGFPVRGVFSS